MGGWEAGECNLQHTLCSLHALVAFEDGVTIATPSIPSPTIALYPPHTIPDGDNYSVKRKGVPSGGLRSERS